MGWKTDGKPNEQEAWYWFLETYPSIAKHLQPFAERGRKRSDKGDYWWELRACSYYEKFELPKIFYQVLPVKPCFIYEETNILCNNSVWFIPTKDKRLLALLNSQPAWWLMKEFCPLIRNGCQLIWDNLRQIPIPKELPQELAAYADKLMEATRSENQENYNTIYEELNAYVKYLYGIDH